MTTKPLRMGTIIPYADRRATPLTWEVTEGALRRRIADLEQGHVAVNVELEAANGRVAELEAAIRKVRSLLGDGLVIAARKVLNEAVDA